MPGQCKKLAFSLLECHNKTLTRSLAFNTCVFKRNMNIIFHEDFEGDMKLWGGESEDLDQNKAITFTLSLTPDIIVIFVYGD